VIPRCGKLPTHLRSFLWRGLQLNNRPSSCGKPSGDSRSQDRQQPASHSCPDSALPVHLTSYCTGFVGLSSTMTSTSCPRFKLKSPRSLTPSLDESTMRHGSVVCFPLLLRRRRARFFTAIRLDRRPPRVGELGTIPPSDSRVQGMGREIVARSRVV
jgi:hypothetical protein